MSCFAELAEKSSKTTARKDDVNVKKTSRRTDRVRLLPWSGDGDSQLLSLVLEVTRRVAALQDAVADMRQEHKLNYRQLKRLMLKLASDGAFSQNSGHRPANFDFSRPRSFVQSGIYYSINYTDIPRNEIR